MSAELQRLLFVPGGNVETSVSSGGAVSQTYSFSSGAAASSSSSSSSSGAVSQITQDLLSLASSGSATTTVSVSGSSSSAAYSQIEAAILNASRPFEVSETETITVNGQTGLWSNRAELQAWSGVIPLTQYVINEDANPEVIRKRTDQTLIYEQEVAVRYLRPPTPPPPGEILIKQEANIPTPPAPPLVIRQQPPRPETPAPLIIREAPPRPPVAVGQKVITISGKRLPPPPRKVVIERLAPLPSKPQSIIIERWLPYSAQKRRVIFQRNTVADSVVVKPRNVIVQWEAPQVTIKKEFRDLGIIRANPVEYVQRYGAELKSYTELPAFVREIRPAAGVVLAGEYTAPAVLELEGDLQALSLIDLDVHGLSEYRFLLTRSSGASVSVSGASVSVSGGGSNVNGIIAELFAQVDRNASGKITLNEAEKILLILNSRLGRSYGDNEAQAFFRALDTNRDGSIDFEEFKSALLRAF